MAIHNSAIMSVRCPMPAIESRGSFPFPTRRLGCNGVFCFLAVFLWGCSDPIRGTGSFDASNLVPNMCPSTMPGTGTRCVSAGETCAYGGCTACVCVSDGTWVCTGGPGDCASCPTTVTADSPCSRNGLTCVRWAFCGGECSCDGTAWSCAPCGGGACGGSACSSSPSCPSTMPNDGETCGAPGNSCVYEWPAGCVKATCSCAVAGWSCSYGNYCQDAGQ